MAFLVTTSIDIDTKPEAVWETLTDFANYSAWSDFIKNIEGIPQMGNKIRVTLPGMKFRARVTTFEPVKHFSWLGHFLFKGLFDGEHSFILSSLPGGGTRFEHREAFSGVLAEIFRQKLVAKLKNDFAGFNVALKKEVENKQN